MKHYECYLFDADGTLIDTAELIYRCFLYTCDRFGAITIDRAAVIAHIGLPLRSQLEVYLGPLDNERAREVMAAHMEYQLSIYREYLRPFAGVAEGLERLLAAGRRLAVVTSRRMDTLELYLRHTGLDSFFEVLVTPEMTAAHKPDPAPVLKALELLGATPGQSLMIGDSGWDITCGSRAGTDTALVSWSEVPEESLAVKPTYRLASMAQLLA